jgi:hypothetical protein
MGDGAFVALGVGLQALYAGAATGHADSAVRVVYGSWMRFQVLCPDGRWSYHPSPIGAGDEKKDSGWRRRLCGVKRARLVCCTSVTPVPGAGSEFMESETPMNPPPTQRWELVVARVHAPS